MEEKKDGLSEMVLSQMEEWLNAPLEAIQGHLKMLDKMRDLHTDDVAALIKIGERICQAKLAAVEPKRGRPKGSKTRKVEVFPNG